MNIKTGTAFLTRQDILNCEHKVENIKNNINSRACISLSLNGFKNIVASHGLQE
jgi:hypothetical protein